MLEKIEREPDLSRRASLLKDYLKGDVDLLNLSGFLRREIEGSTSETWTLFCQEIQSWIRVHFESPIGHPSETSPLLRLSQTQRRLRLEEYEKKPEGVRALLSPGSDLIQLLEQDPETLQGLLRVLQRELQMQKKKQRAQHLQKPPPKHSPPTVDLGESLGHHLRVFKVLVVSVHGLLKQSLTGLASVIRQSARFSRKLLLKLAELERIIYHKVLASLRFSWEGFSRVFNQSFLQKSVPVLSVAALVIWISTQVEINTQSGPAAPAPESPVDSSSLAQANPKPAKNSSDKVKGGFNDLLGQLESFRSTTSVTLTQKSSDFIMLAHSPAPEFKTRAEIEIKSPKKLLKKEPRIQVSQTVQLTVSGTPSLPSATVPMLEQTAAPKTKSSSSTVIASHIPAKSAPASKPPTIVLAKALEKASPSPSSAPKPKPMPEPMPELEAKQKAKPKSNQSLKSHSWKGRSHTVLIVGKEKYGRADTVILSRIDSQRGQIRLLSLPRDMRVKINHMGKIVRDKLSHTLRWGQIELLKDTLTVALGFPIDYHLQIDLDLFRKLIDVIGGVELEVESDFHYVDKAGGLAIHLDKGFQLLDGSNAEGYVRFRGDGKGDLGRIQRQQKFIRVFLKKIKTLKSISWENLKVLARLPGFLVDVIKEIKSDIPPSMYLEFLRAYARVSHKNIQFKTVAGHAEYVHVGKKKPVSFYLSDDREIHESKTWLLSEVISKKKQLASIKSKKSLN